MSQRSSTPGEQRQRPAVPPLDDGELARALMKGDPEAAPLAWRRFYPVVLGTLRRLRGGAQFPDTLSQDVFIRFFSKVRDLKKQDSLRAFITAIAFRRAREELKRRRVRRTSAPTVAAYQTQLSAGRDADPERRHAITRLSTVMDRLEPGDRRVYALRFVEGWELAEIAASLRVSVSTVRRSIRRASVEVEKQMRTDPVLAGYIDHDRTVRASGRRR